MESAQIKTLFDQFVLTFDVAKSKRIWEKQNADFREFWEKVIMGEKEKLSEDKLISIIQILDTNASRGGKKERVYEEAVCRAIIYQNFWEGVFRELKKDKRLRLALNNVFIANSADKRIRAVDELKKINIRGNALTGDKAVMLNCIIAGYDAFENLSMVSLEHRFWAVEAFDIKKAMDLNEKSYGHRIVLSNARIIEKFREIIGSGLDARSLSRFLYSDPVKAIWFHKAEPVIDDKEKAEAAENYEETAEEDIGQSFKFERHLEDFLLENWDRLEFTGPYELLTNDDGQIKDADNKKFFSEQFQTHDPDVGRIDILARDRNNHDYVIFELKKNRPVDHVVGQVRKYIEWVREKRALPEHVGVRGLIVVPGMSKDLEYASRGMKDVEVCVYNINFVVSRQKV